MGSRHPALKKNEVELKAGLATKERELQGGSAESAIQPVGAPREIDIGFLSREMSQIGLKYKELVKLNSRLKN